MGEHDCVGLSDGSVGFVHKAESEIDRWDALSGVMEVVI